MDRLYDFAGQTVTIGSMWAWQVTGKRSWEYPLPAGHNIVPHINGTPFNIITYLQKVVGEIPSVNADYYFNDEGSCEYADATFHISVYYYNGRAFFCATCMPHDPAYMCGRVRSCTNYTGCDISNITELDMNFANVWVYENDVPDDYTRYVTPENPGNIAGDSWRLLMLGWAYGVEGITPDDFYREDQGTFYDDFHVPSFNEGTGVQGGYFPTYSVGWLKYLDGYHLPSFMFSAIETWEDVPQQTGGGGGKWGFAGQRDGIDELMILDFTDLGFTTMYAPDESQLKALSRVLWDDTFLTAMEKSAVGDPMNAIISLTAVPLNLASIKDVAENVVIGKYTTGIYMPTLTQSSIRIDFGSIPIDEKWGTAVDYSRSVEVFLPFIGWVQVNISEVMGGKIHLYYDVNLLSGDFIAKLEITNTWMGVTVPITVYQHNGNLQCSIPVTSMNYSDYYKNRVGGATQIISAVASGLSGNVMGAVQGVIGGTNQMLSPPTVARSGNLNGAGSLMSLKVAKVVIRTPNQYIPKPEIDFAPLKGFPAYKACKIKDLSGYAEIDCEKLQGFTGTETEMSEYMELIRGGVFF